VGESKGTCQWPPVLSAERLSSKMHSTDALSTLHPPNDPININIL
jgi:hypothetical protein